MSLKTSLIRIGNHNPKLRKHIRAILGSIESSDNWYKKAKDDEVTPELLKKLGDDSHKVLSDIAKDLSEQKGKLIEAVEGSVRGEAIVIAKVDGGVSGDYNSYNFEGQSHDASIGGTVHAFFEIDSDKDPKKRIIASKLGRVYQDLVKSKLKADRDPEQIRAEVSSPRKQTDGTWLVEVIFQLWWMV